MHSRQPRLGDILDDYCPRERRVTNHAVVAMVGADVKQTRCTTCDADHEYKHAKVPRQRRKSDTPAILYAHVAAGAPKRVVHDGVAAEQESVPSQAESTASPVVAIAADKDPLVDGDNPVADADNDSVDAEDAAGTPGNAGNAGNEDGPVHRQLIRATLPRTEGQPPPQRPAPDFTIRQPAGRPGRFRPRPQQGGGQSFGNTGRPNNNGGSVRGGPRNQSHQSHQGPHGQGRPQGGTAFRADRQGSGRRRSK